MARIRTIKPDFFRHELLQDLESSNPGMYPMMVFAGLWGHCDSKGRFEWRPRQLKLDILPFLPFDMGKTLLILEQYGLVNRYIVDEKEYGEIPTFEKHQRISGKELTGGEKFPKRNSEAIVKQQGSIGEIPGSGRDIQESQEGKGMEGNGVNPLSDKSDGVRLANGKQKFKDDAIQVLEFLNQKTGKHYRPLKANLDLIAARLAEGAQVSDCRGIIVRQARKWMGTEQEMYLRPATLFNATKFAQYSGEIGHD